MADSSSSGGATGLGRGLTAATATPGERHAFLSWPSAPESVKNHYFGAVRLPDLCARARAYGIQARQVAPQVWGLVWWRSASPLELWVVVLVFWWDYYI